MTEQPDPPNPEELERRIRWFEQYTDMASNNSVHRPPGDLAYACPCCGYLTFDGRDRERDLPHVRAPHPGEYPDDGQS